MAKIPSYFQRYLRAIQPTRASRRLAIQLHTTLSERLAGDETFRDWFQSTFLYGSYKRNTAVQPIKDVDVCVILDIDPNDEKHTPTKVVTRLRDVLEQLGYKDKTALQRRSVRIDLSNITLDVVPIVQPIGSEDPLLIPDRPLSQWIETHPKGHLAEATRLNKACNGRYIPFVKIVKAWYRHQMKDIERPKPKGFTLEALVARYHDPDAPTYAEAFVNFLDRLWADCGVSLSSGIFPPVPDPGRDDEYLTLTFTKDEVETFSSAVTTCLADARTALTAEGIAPSAKLWQSILGPKFPTTPASGRLTEAKGIGLDEDLETDEVDDEVTGVELPPRRWFGDLQISVWWAYKENDAVIEQYHGDGRALKKNLSLRFRLERTSIAQPYQIRWIVENDGYEARQQNDLGHVKENGAKDHWERTAYTGSHLMICELHRGDKILARAKQIVRIL